MAISLKVLVGTKRIYPSDWRGELTPEERKVQATAAGSKGGSANTPLQQAAHKQVGHDSASYPEITKAFRDNVVLNGSNKKQDIISRILLDSKTSEETKTTKRG